MNTIQTYMNSTETKRKNKWRYLFITAIASIAVALITAMFITKTEVRTAQFTGNGQVKTTGQPQQGKAVKFAE